ncbi:MAG: AtpZ/AtpI family protein [candidate division WOR-3 bacterium]
MDLKRDKTLKNIILYSSIGLEFALSVIVGIAIGWFLDKKFNTYPFLTITFLFFGLGAGIKGLFRALKKLERENWNQKT